VPVHLRHGLTGHLSAVAAGSTPEKANAKAMVKTIGDMPMKRIAVLPATLPMIDSGLGRAHPRNSPQAAPTIGAT